MNLVLSTGTNIGNRTENLNKAYLKLSTEYQFIAKSRIYSSPAVDYTNQPDFLNQVLSFKIPDQSPSNVIDSILKIESSMGRIRNIDKGPRIIDIDILFWGVKNINLPNLIVPHPRLFERSFIVLPLKELAVFTTLKKHFEFPDTFSNQASPFE